jgi:hypothetical protein
VTPARWISSITRNISSTGHEPAADRDHLLLAARQRPRELPLPLAEPREDREDALEPLALVRPRALRVAAEQQVVPHRHLGEELAPLRHLHDPALDDLHRRAAPERRAVERHRAGARPQDAGDRLQRRRLPGAVRADEGDDLAGGHLEGDAPERLDPAVRDLEPLDAQHRHAARLPK